MISANNQSISCLMCTKNKKPVEVLKLKCNHNFCWLCLDVYLHKNLNARIKCPNNSCNKFFTDKEIRMVLSDKDIEIYEKKIMGLSNDIKKCLLPNCEGIVVCGDCDTQYTCELCNMHNCVVCKAPHGDYKCNGFQSLPPQVKMAYKQVEMKKAEKVYEQTKIEHLLEKKKYNDQHSIVYNNRIFTCSNCMSDLGRGAGLVLQNCGCQICKLCLIQAILTSPSILVLCPICFEQHINSEEIQNILSSDQLKTYQNKCSNIAKSKLDTSFRSPEVWFCVDCKTSLQKISESNWIQCPNCKIELCWIRKMKRWGPKGRGDISGGCKCGVNGIPCHADCKSNCHPRN